ncbi:DUF2975 domain-containing protein [Plantibacter flavus]|uniref:DUF2975 domain-containing protein n=1 Tax=Plantibacter flavus TaxID=150123 RepID=UPI002379E670|nr:DUF2975 domain-containing protein [Plantibacter flavus]MDD9151355.1 DUF2975 domain-containing protein [Plantibacter flavus]
MRGVTVLVLRVILAVVLVGSLVVQVVMVPLLWADLDGVDEVPRTLFAIIVIAEIITFQLCAVCVWALLDLVRRGRVFSARSFRFVDVIIGAIAVSALLTFGLAVLLAPGGIAPGVIGLLCGAALVTAGVALVVVVMRSLLRQAVDREIEAQGLRSELDDVI